MPVLEKEPSTTGKSEQTLLQHELLFAAEMSYKTIWEILYFIILYNYFEVTYLDCTS